MLFKVVLGILVFNVIGCVLMLVFFGDILGLGVFGCCFIGVFLVGVFRL